MFPPEFEKDVGMIIQEYIQEVVSGLRQICTNAIIPIRDKIIKTVGRGGNIFAFGNGGSHSEADAFLFALDAEISPDFQFSSFGCPKLSETLDTQNEKLFGRTLRRNGKPDDVAVLISASGNSLNIIDASRLCKQIGIVTMSISAEGAILNNNSALPDHRIVIPLRDQQKLEEVTLGTLLILARQIGLELIGKQESIEITREEYLSAFSQGITSALPPKLLLDMVEDIVLAFKTRHVVRIDATSGALVAPAEHMAHNLQWDVRDEAKEVLPNLVRSGLLPCHMTGVGNDGGCGFNSAIELLDNGIPGDVEIILATNLDDIKTYSISKAAQKKGVSIHALCFDSMDKFAAAGAAQAAAHLTGRLTNTRILLEQEVISTEKAREWVRTHDLALLRKKAETKAKLEKRFRKLK